MTTSIPTRLFLLLFFLLSPSASAQLILSADASSAPAHSLIHLTAVLPANIATTVTFLSDSQPLASVPVTSNPGQSYAILGVASLPAGTHTLTATAAALTSNPVTLVITSLPSTLTTVASAATIYSNSPLTVTSTIQPADASGTITITDAASTAAPTPIRGTSVPAWQTFGDLLTSPSTTAPPYPTLLAAANNLALTNFASPAALACDILPWQILASSLGPTQTAAPLTSVMTGANEAAAFDPSAYNPIFNTCLQSTLAWLAIPREYKLLPGDPAITTTGLWTITSQPFGTTLFNSTGIGAARFTITTGGAPIYLWYLLADQLPGAFTLAIDGVSTATTYATQPSSAIASTQSQSVGYALIRLPVAPGLHVLELTVQSGSVGILAAATAASPAGASVHPTILVADVPTQNTSSPAAKPAAVTAYTQSIQSSVTLLQSDSLNLLSISTRSTFTGDRTEFLDATHPSTLGQSHLAAAFQPTFATLPLTPFATFAGQPALSTITLTTPGSHTLTSTYSGDSTYAAASAQPLTITVLPQTGSATTLTTTRTRYTTADTIPFTASVTPSTASGTITLYDGTAFLAQQPLASSSTAFTTSTLQPGYHSITAVYSGDAPDTSSASPVLTVQVDRASPTLTLAPVAATLPAGVAQILTAAIQPATGSGPITFTDLYQPPGQTPAQTLTLGQSALTGGSASIATTPLAPGTHTITATYPGDALNLPATSSPISTQVLAAVSTTTLVTPSAAPIYATPITLIASVLPATATGTVTFQESLSGSIATVPLTSASASYTTAALTPGPHTLSAIYSGDNLTAPSTSPSAILTVTRTPTTITLIPLPATLPAGTLVTLTAALDSTSATGTVIFRDALTGVLGESTITNSIATLTLPALLDGSYSISATYSGDSIHAPTTSAPITTQVELAATTLTLAPLPSSAFYGSKVILTATLSPAPATGTITFSEAPSVLGTSLLANAAATLSIANLLPGTHTIHASFPGDPTHAAALSTSQTITITPAPTGTSLALAQLSVITGQPATVDVQVTAPTIVPGGTITLQSGATVLASAPISELTATAAFATLTVPTASLGPGAYAITAIYSGSSTCAPSSSLPVTLTIAPIPTATSLAILAPQTAVGTPVTLSATVTAAAQPPIGSLTFRANGTLITSVPLDAAGRATATFTPATAGTYALTAVYDPSGLFAASTASPLSINATLPVAISVSPANLNLASASAQSVTLTVLPLSGFTGPVTAACQPSRSFITCTVDPIPPLTSASAVNAAIHITTSASPLARSELPRLIPTVTLCALLLPVILPRRARRSSPTPLILLIAIATSLSGCAEGGTFGDVPPGAYPVQLTIIAAGTILPATITVTIPK